MSGNQKHQVYSKKNRFKNSGIAAFAQDINLRDKAIFSGWIAGIFLLISILWILTEGVQTHYLMRTVNSIFINNNDSRRITSHIEMKAGKAGLLGHWYQMYNSSDKMFVFSIFKDGILIPAGAVVSDNGVVGEIIPLSAHAVQVFDTLPGSILQMYTRRIEDAARGEME